MDVALLSQGDPAVQSSSSGELKRKRTPTDESHPPLSAPPHKTAKTTNAHLAINYLARQCAEDLPLICNDDSLTSILHLLGDYQGVLERHESMACNLGARPLGPILIKRFERLFDGPPKVLKNHGKEGNTVSWLDVVEFARNKPEQFTLGQMSEGARVCQFYTKQCRVQISEEDYVLISSGIPQKMIPPQPIIEDEEKELGTLEILEKNLGNICHLADQVAARTRQLKHRINGRKQAILERRATESEQGAGATSPSLANGTNGAVPSIQPHSGFLAVNARRSIDGNGNTVEYSKTGASSSTRTELMSKFFSQAEKERRNAEKSATVNGTSGRLTSLAVQNATGPYAIQYPRSAAQLETSQALLHSRSESYDKSHHHHSSGQLQDTVRHERAPSSPGTILHTAHPYTTAPHPHTQSQATTPSTSVPKEKDTDGPYKTEMVSRMETLKRGDRVLPPCDRCRRLHMDCIKNLTACAGCTKKHAKCSWRDVRETELFGPEAGKILISGTSIVEASGLDSDREPSVGLRPDPSHEARMTNGNGIGVKHVERDRESVMAGRESARLLALEGLQAAERQTGESSGEHTPEGSEKSLPQHSSSAMSTPQGLPFPPSTRYDIARLPSPRTENANNVDVAMTEVEPSRTMVH